MRLLIFSDIHADLKTLERHMDTEADYYFAAGDMANWAKGLDRIGEILTRRAGKLFVMPGNHESVDDISLLCERYNLANFHGKSILLGGYYIAGLGYSNRTPFHTPGEYSEDQLTARLHPFADLKPLILICHCPPKNTPLDRAGEGLHFGSTAVRQFIDIHQPDYFFCGHIHEAEGAQTTLGATKAVNVGKRGFLLEIA